MDYDIPFDAIVFDLDGTLIDSVPDVRAAVNRVLAEHGRAGLSIDDVKILVGWGGDTLIAKAFEQTGGPLEEAKLEDMRLRFLATYADHPADHSRIFPGAVEILEGLRDAGIKMGICTNKPYRLTKLLLAALDLEGWFGAVLGGDSLAIRKPDGGHLLGVIEALGVTAGEAAMVGDSGNDVACARDAAVPVIAVAYGYTQVPAEALGADFVIARFADLPQALARLPRRPAKPA